MKFLKEMKKEQKMLLGSLAAGLAAALLAFFLMDDVRKRIEAGMDPVEVAAAVRFIPAFAELDASNTALIKVPKKLVTGAHIKDLSSLKGKRVLVPFVANEAIMANKIAERGDEINTVIPTGMRAVSLGVNRENSVAYSINPGDHVDILLTYDVSSETETISKTVTVLQSILVIAVGGSITPLDKTKQPEFDTVTLAVTPDEAAVVTFALEKGRLNFALRPVGDRKKELVNPATFDDIEKRSKMNSVNPDSMISLPAKKKPDTSPAQPLNDGEVGRRSIE